MNKELIPVAVAVKLAQDHNREMWIKNTISKMNKTIENEAREGKRELHVDLNKMIEGAENIFEIAEMFASFHRQLEEAGYENEVTPDSEVIIRW